VLVDLAQAAHSETFPKLVEHPHIGNSVAIAQVGKAAPLLLLRQHLDQQVERMDRAEKGQQVDAPQLGGTKMSASAPASDGRQQLVNKSVRDVRREFREERYGTGRRKQ
jgi:hypothetical protein